MHAQRFHPLPFACGDGYFPLSAAHPPTPPLKSYRNKLRQFGHSMCAGSHVTV